MDRRPSTISPADFASLIRDKKTAVDIIDVRTPAEFQEIHLDGAKNIPLHELTREAVRSLRRDPEGPLYIVCRSGSRGMQGCEKLLQAGETNVINIEGGTLACVQAGLPTKQGKKVMSLERQVRIAAGSLVVIGAVLGWFVHPYLHGLSAFIGAGLVFAGVTDTCGMGMVIARMPWNQQSASAKPVCLQ